MLPVEECKIWLEHLKTIVENHTRGAKKAAATRRSKKVGVPDTCVEDHTNYSNDGEEDGDQYESTYCATCGDDEGELEQQELWIACDLVSLVV